MKNPFDYVWFLGAIFVLLVMLSISHKLNTISPPKYIQNFCQAQQEARQVPYEKCMSLIL
jgi:hypothetical protein